MLYALNSEAMAWTVEFTGKAQKQYARLSEKIQLIVAALAGELETEGPSQPEWRHFGKLQGSADCYHCHLKTGRPTYVACWQALNRKIELMEVNYVGSHESAPY
jgi:mRNA-degrading endonuclease RelE of RelBE toxin-antitoxin system